MARNDTVKSFTSHVTLCTGFLQTLGKPNGLTKLAGRLREIEGLHVDTPMDWDANPQRRARWVAGAYDYTAPHFIVGYSFGANSTIAMCRELQEAGRWVDGIFLIDGVKRFPWLPKALSLWPWHKLKVPSNVLACRAWRQLEGAPKGHPVFWDKLAVKATFLKVPHVDMDDDDQIHDSILADIDAAVALYKNKGIG